MKALTKLLVAVACLGAAMLPLASYAKDGGWKAAHWKHGREAHDSGRHYGHWKHHHRQIVVIREPVFAYREYPVERYTPVYPRPAVIIHIPPLIFPF